MGGLGSGRKPNEKTIIQRTSGTPVNLSGNSFELPNTSGDHLKGIKRQAPVQDYDLVNKKYVDDELTTHEGTAQAHSDYLLNSGDTATGDYTFDTNTLHIDSTNNRVGIATASPGAMLEVGGKTNEDGIIRITGDSGGTDRSWDLKSEGTAREFSIIDHNLADTTRLLIDSNGNVGIGTSTPDGNFHVAGANSYFGTDDTTAATMRIYGGGTGSNEGGEIQLFTATDHDTTYEYYFIDAFQDDLRIGRAGQAADIRLTSDGKVGIGTATPSQLLDVAGNSADTAIEITNSQVNSVSRLLLVNDAQNWDMRVAGSNVFIIRDNTNSNNVFSIEPNAPANSLYIEGSGDVGIGTASPNESLTVEAGVMSIKETTTPTATTNYGKIYTKSDNKLYFQDGAGTEHEIAFV